MVGLDETLTLDVNESKTYTKTYTVTENDMLSENTTIVNVAKVSSTETGEKEDDATVEKGEWAPNITVNKTSNKNQKVSYADTITYTLTAKNDGNRIGTTTIKDTIPTGTELSGSINVKVGNASATTITAEQLANGYEITLDENEIATITFTVVVKTYSGETITNTATYKNPDEDEKNTETTTVKVEDAATVIPTVSSTTEQTVPQKAILLLDFSYSMDEKINGVKKITSLKSAVETFLDKFLANGQNQVMIIKYARDVHVECDYTNSKTVAYNSIRYESTEASTNIDGALTLANSKIPANAQNTSVIIMTDGVPNIYVDNRTGAYHTAGDGYTYNATSADQARESANWIKNKGATMYSIGFGLDQIGRPTIANPEGDPYSREQAKKLIKDMGTKYKADGTLEYDNHYDTFDGPALEQAFKDIVESITTVTNLDPIRYETVDGKITISDGFRENEKVEIYSGTYTESSTPITTYNWNEFIGLSYTTYSGGKITFDLGNYMKDNSILPNVHLTLRFVD